MDVIGAAGSLLGGIYSSHMSLKSMREQIRAQQRENQLNREYNSQEARLAREYNTQMVNSQNEYNLPSNQVQRLKDAGLNPALFYGEGANGITSVGVGSTNAQSQYQGHIGSPLPDFSGIKEAANNAANVISTMSESRYRDALSRLSDKELAWFDKTKENELNIGNSVVLLNGSQRKLNIQNRINLAKTCTQIEENIKYTQSLTTGQELKNYISAIDAFWADKQHAADFVKTMNESDMFASQAHLNVVQAENITKLFTLQAALMRAQALNLTEEAKYFQALTSKEWQYMKDVMPELADSIMLENDGLRIDLETRKIRNYVNIAGSFVGELVGALFLGAGTKTMLGGAGRAVVKGFKP